jgi:hypothetical protein
MKNLLNMDRAKIVDHYLSKVNDKDFSVFDVRKELERNNVDEQEIKVIVRLVDNELQRRITGKSAVNKSKEIMWFGGVITTAGLILTIGTYTGAMEMGDHFLLAYGPILGGLSILFYGMGKRR